MRTRVNYRDNSNDKILYRFSFSLHEKSYWGFNFVGNVTLSALIDKIYEFFLIDIAEFSIFVQDSFKFGKFKFLFSKNGKTPPMKSFIPYLQINESDNSNLSP